MKSVPLKLRIEHRNTYLLGVIFILLTLVLFYFSRTGNDGLGVAKPEPYRLSAPLALPHAPPGGASLSLPGPMAESGDPHRLTLISLEKAIARMRSRESREAIVISNHTAPLWSEIKVAVSALTDERIENEFKEEARLQATTEVSDQADIIQRSKTLRDYLVFDDSIGDDRHRYWQRVLVMKSDFATNKITASLSSSDGLSFDDPADVQGANGFEQSGAALSTRILKTAELSARYSHLFGVDSSDGRARLQPGAR